MAQRVTLFATIYRQKPFCFSSAASAPTALLAKKGSLEVDVSVQVEMKSTRLTNYVSSPSTESYNGVLDISMVIFNVDVCSNSKNKCDVTTTTLLFLKAVLARLCSRT